MSSHGTCNWHTTGTPSYCQGESHKWRWFVPGCPACIAKWAGREVTADVLTPEQLVAAIKAARPKTNWDQKHRWAAAKKLACMARTTPRAE
jgi:hypothetical protein